MRTNIANVKKLLLILLAVLLPLQTMAATERAFAHALEGSGMGSFQHLLEHEAHVQHHHDDDGDEHDDDSPASAQHMLDHEHACGSSYMVQAVFQVPTVPAAHTKPMSLDVELTSRTTAPLLRPPHAPA